jgi:hypothetical protein
MINIIREIIKRFEYISLIYQLILQTFPSFIKAKTYYLPVLFEELIYISSHLIHYLEYYLIYLHLNFFV